jgi:hypothetical protein
MGRAVLTALMGIGEPGFECFAFRAYAAGDACPDSDEGFELLMDVEHVGMTPSTGPCKFLAGAQTRAGVSNCVIGVRSLRQKSQQMEGYSSFSC